jgi:hypothetical protein
MRKRTVRILKPLDAFSVENGVGAGTPDVNYVDGWLELKSLEGWPEDGPLRVPHFTVQQRLWLRKRWLKGGEVYMLLKVADDWLLLNGWDAAAIVGKATRAQLIEASVAVWIGGLDKEGLLSELDKRPTDRCGRRPC